MSNTRKTKDADRLFDNLFKDLDKGMEEAFQGYLTAEHLEDTPAVRVGFYAALIQEVADDQSMNDDPELRALIVEHLKQIAKKYMGESVRNAVQEAFKDMVKEKA